MDFVLGLDISVLGNPDKYADAILGKLFPIQSGIVDRFVGAINGNRSCPSTATDFFAFLMPQLVKIADAGQHVTNITGFESNDSGFPGQQGRAKFVQIVPVGSGQTDSGDHDPLFGGKLTLRTLHAVKAIRIMMISSLRIDWTDRRLTASYTAGKLTVTHFGFRNTNRKPTGRLV